MSYYSRFRFVIGTPIWRLYLRWAYSTCLKNLTQLNFAPNFHSKNFSCLLCGVGNEVTADEFIGFTLQRNNKARIWIIDLGQEQVQAVKNLVNKKYRSANITVIRIDALKLETVLPRESLDWIETDAVEEFFDYQALERLFGIWNRLLKKNGFVTTMATSNASRLERWVDKLKIWAGRSWLGIKAYSHSRARLHRIIKNSGFHFFDQQVIFPYFRRYSITKL